MEDELVELLVGAGLTGIASQLKNISKDEAVEDYEKLRGTKCGEINQRSLVGNKAMDFFFFKHRIRTKSKKGVSLVEWLKRKKSEAEERLITRLMKDGKSRIIAEFDTFRLYLGSINAFKPIIARYLYCLFNPTTILDFSAGWGGRCLGAMSLDKNYIGFDTNTTLKEAYSGMKSLYPTKGKIEIVFKDSSKVDYSKYDYDMVFTSPPYYQKTRPTEKYEKMPEYKDRADFNERFFFPVVRNTYEHLKKGGVYCLNIPMDMYDDVKKVLGKADKKIPLVIAKRAQADKFGGGYKEYIYVWKKDSLKGKGDERLPAPTWKHDSLELKKSNIPNAGRGVFATKPIKKGERIADYVGTEMTMKRFLALYPNDRRYYYRMKRIQKVIDGHNHKTANVSHYVNESKNPNVALMNKGLVTIKDIPKGGELYLTYPKGYSRTYTV